MAVARDGIPGTRGPLGEDEISRGGVGLGGKRGGGAAAGCRRWGTEERGDIKKAGAEGGAEGFRLGRRVGGVAEPFPAGMEV
jgi:hypothetical protein